MNSANIMLKGLLVFWLLAVYSSIPALAATRPNIILITIDALRADHVSAYGYHRETTPFIDSLARKGTVFTRAYSASSWTSPSIASIFTGFYPWRHGVVKRTFRGKKLNGGSQLNPKYTTLAEQFKRAGYFTAGFSSNPNLNKKFGFAQGFDLFFEFFNFFKKEKGKSRNAKRVGLVIKENLDSIRKKPFFMWIHYFDPHHPYHLREPWMKKYFPSQYPRQLYRPRSRITVKAPAPRKHPQTIEFIKAAYDSEINYADSYIKKLFESIPTKNSIVIITADHGEEFQEHGTWEHARNLFNTSIQVPLIIRKLDAPPKGVKIDFPVSLVDLHPALLALAHIPIPPGLDGYPLPFKPVRKKRPGIIYSSLDRGICTLGKAGNWNIPMVSAIKDNYKIHKNLDTGRESLYNLTGDPEEMRDISDDQPEIMGKMQSIMSSWLDRRKQGPLFPMSTGGSSPVNNQLLEQLRSLGYAQ